ncbi:MAG: TRAP transporter small permease [Rhodospirillales bacterium]|jgi:TRAP-type C4-dicarboxylate transport system permease small subunit
MSSELPAWEAKIEGVAESFAKTLNIISGVWLSSIALLILYDVIGREAFGIPFHGTNEIVSNSVLSILMLQLPLAILNRSSLRTTILYGKLGPRGKSIIEAVSYFFAALLFLGIGFGGWDNMIEAWDILELEGSGVVEIPVYPIRSLVVIIGFIGSFVCSLMVYHALKRPEDFAEEVAVEEMGE